MVDRESKRSGKNKCLVLFNFIHDYIVYGVNPKEYYWFYFDGKNIGKEKNFFTKKMFQKLIKRNNDPLFVQILNDKYIFSQTFAEFTGRKVIRSGKNIDAADLERVLRDTEHLIYKPKDSSVEKEFRYLIRRNFRM